MPRYLLPTYRVLTITINLFFFYYYYLDEESNRHARFFNGYRFKYANGYFTPWDYYEIIIIYATSTRTHTRETTTDRAFARHLQTWGIDFFSSTFTAVILRLPPFARPHWYAWHTICTASCCCLTIIFLPTSVRSSHKKYTLYVECVNIKHRT